MIKKLLHWVMHTKIYACTMLKIVPYIRFTLYYPSMRGATYHRGYNILQPGDFVVAVDKKKLTSMLVPGIWTHAGFCVAKDGVWEISEMTHENYVKSCFFDICKEADRVAIFRGNMDSSYIQKMIDTCKSFETATYDIDFELGVKELYCSELVYQSDLEHRFGFDLTDIVDLGTPYISPDGLTQGKNVQCVWDSDKA